MKRLAIKSIDAVHPKKVAKPMNMKILKQPIGVIIDRESPI